MSRVDGASRRLALTLVASARHLGILVALLASMGCGTDDNDPEAAGSGEPCGYLCGGPACNHRCIDDVLYYCGGDEELQLVEDCNASGRKCVFVDLGNDATGVPDGKKECQ